MIFAGSIGSLGIFPNLSPNKKALEENSPSGYNRLPNEIKTIFENKKKISTVQSSLKQVISTPNGTEKRSGYYWANAKGQFRIVFFSPSETVVYDGKLIYWRIDSNPFTWTIKGPQPDMLPKLASNEIPEGTSIKLKEKPFFNFWNNHLRTLVLTGKKNTTIEVTIDLLRKGIVQRKMLDEHAREILIEKFSSPLERNSLIFFRDVSVTAKNPNTNQRITNRTIYENPVLNVRIMDSLFRPLPGPYRTYNP